MIGLLRRWAGDLPLVGGVLALTLFGLAMIYSAGQTRVPDPVVVGAWARQALVAFTVVRFIKLDDLESLAYPAYALGLALLAATLIVGTGAGTAAGTKSWIEIGPLRFQPAEPAKLATILAASAVSALLTGLIWVFRYFSR